jgi:hypothetical protein
METTKLKLAIRLQEISEDLAKRAETGEFSDFESQHACPKIELVGCLSQIYKTTTNLKRAQLAHNLATEVMEGKWDETREEADAWYQSEGKALLGAMAKGKK